MSERGPSRTAYSVAAHRAVHQLLDGLPKILDDPISPRLLDEPALASIRANADLADAPAARALRTHVALRSRFSEDRLAEAVRRGVGQCVILGAGLDTFAYRQPAWASALRIYEVDQPASQAEKRRRLVAASIAAPGNVEFTPIDFERSSLRDGLAASSLDFGDTTFFSCLGVLVYLTADAIDAIFSLVASFPKGSEIAFTFYQQGIHSALAEGAARVGEPWLSEIDPATLEQRLLGLGFSAVEFLTPEQAKTTYFTETRSDGLREPQRCSIASAKSDRAAAPLDQPSQRHLAPGAEAGVAAHPRIDLTQPLEHA